MSRLARSCKNWHQHMGLFVIFQVILTAFRNAAIGWLRLQGVDNIAEALRL